MRRISLVLLVGLAAASVGGAGAASSTGDRSAAVLKAADCTAAEKAQRQRALSTYQKTMMARRRAFFRSHSNPRARRAFVRRQQAKLRALRQAAACTVIPLGARIVATIPIPNEGGVGVGAGSVWVTDRSSGLLRRVDPATNSVADEIPGGRGAAPVVGEGAVWVASALLNRLLRVDLDEPHGVTQIETGSTSDEWPIAVVMASGSPWVGNHHGGTVVRIDPRSNAILATVRWGDRADGGIYHMTTDGASIWIAGSATSDVAELDTKTNRIVRRTPVPTGTCGGMSVDASAVWITSGFDRPYACWKPENWGVSRIDRATGAVTRIDVGGRPIEVRDAFGSVWVLIDAPRLELVRLDPTTFRVIGRLPLLTQRCVPQNTGSCPGAEYGSALAVGFDSLWVRVSTLGLVPGLPAPPGAPQALLRIEPRP